MCSSLRRFDGVAFALLLFAAVGFGSAAAVPQRRFYVGTYSPVGYPDFPNCSVATYVNFQSEAFIEQYTADGFVYRLGYMDNSIDGVVVVLPHAGSETPTEINYLSGQLSLFGRNGNILNNGPYNATMQIGTTATDYNGNPVAYANFTRAMMNAMSLANNYQYIGSAAVIDCGVPAKVVTPPTRRFFLGKLRMDGYPQFPKCTTATLEAYQSTAFRAQYNWYGNLTVLGELSNSVDCRLTVLTTDNRQPARLKYESGNVAPFNAAGSELCNGPYGTAMRLGATAPCDNCGAAAFAFVTPSMQQYTTVGGVDYGGALALLDCESRPPPTTAPTPRFFLAAYNSAGYTDLNPNCSVATLPNFQSKAFRDQYNYYGYLSWFGPIPNALSCCLDIVPFAGGPIGTLSFADGCVIPFGRDGYDLCSGPYNATMRIGVNQVSDNEGALLFDFITEGMQNSATVGSFTYTGSLALLDCQSPVPAPPPPRKSTFFISAYQPTGGYDGHCTLATLLDVSSPGFRHQYNQDHALAIRGQLLTSLDCRFTISQTTAAVPATISFADGYVASFAWDGNELCNGPYNTTMRIGTTQVSENDGAALFDSLTESMQQGFGLGQFQTNQSLAIIKCSGGAD